MTNTPYLFDYIRPSFDLLVPSKRHMEPEPKREIETATEAQQPTSRTEPGGYGHKE